MTQLTKLLFAALTSFVVSLLVGPMTIKLLRRLKFGQSIRNDGPQTHLKKAGTPTMGGVMILFSLIVSLIAVRAFSREVLWVLFLTIGFGTIGFIDDLIIIIFKRSLGLKARQKIFAQLVIAGIAITVLISSDISTSQLVPFTGYKLSFPEVGWGNPLFFLFALFVLLGGTNAVNLTDGLDGLAAGTMAIASLAMAGLMLLQNQIDLAVFALALAGACFGFTWFNGPPAQVFMGDTGSLALGGALGGMALFGQLTLFLPIVGGVFVAETLSVIIQVISFKTTGKRVFKMSPLHHHFELGGMMEPQIMLRFWMAGVVLGVLGIMGYLFR
jgi:phospho-N-acetylmuramoyl-pentapeptide-transferase